MHDLPRPDIPSHMVTCPLTVLWLILSSGRFIGFLARNLALLRRLLTVRLLMCSLTIHRLRIVLSVLNGCCLASLLRNLSSIGGRFQRLSCTLAFFYTPGLIHELLQSNNDRVAYIESFSSLSVGHTTPYHSNRLPSLCIWQFSTCHVEIKLRKFKVLHVLHVQIPIWNPRQTWVL